MNEILFAILRWLYLHGPKWMQRPLEAMDTAEMQILYTYQDAAPTVLDILDRALTNYAEWIRRGYVGRWERFQVDRREAKYAEHGVDQAYLTEIFGMDMYHNVFSEHDIVTRQRLRMARMRYQVLPENIQFKDRPAAAAAWLSSYEQEMYRELASE